MASYQAKCPHGFIAKDSLRPCSSMTRALVPRSPKSRTSHAHTTTARVRCTPPDLRERFSVRAMTRYAPCSFVVGCMLSMLIPHLQRSVMTAGEHTGIDIERHTPSGVAIFILQHCSFAASKRLVVGSACPNTQTMPELIFADRSPSPRSLCYPGSH